MNQSSHEVEAMNRAVAMKQSKCRVSSLWMKQSVYRNEVDLVWMKLCINESNAIDL